MAETRIPKPRPKKRGFFAPLKRAHKNTGNRADAKAAVWAKIEAERKAQEAEQAGLEAEEMRRLGQEADAAGERGDGDPWPRGRWGAGVGAPSPHANDFLMPKNATGV